MNEVRRNKFLFMYLLFSALVCGAAVMVIEVLGSRVVGPFFGVSLFVWTSLISVTLISLALGYWFGGVLADRRGHSADLYALIAAAGVCVLLIPWLKAPVLEASLPLGLRAGAFVSSMILFGPALLLLGSVSPYLVKIAARAVDNIGRTVGGLYALSTVGSVAGTALTGFYLIAHLGVNQAFFAVGMTLLLIAAIYFVVLRRLIIATAAIVICFALAPQWIVPPALNMPNAQVREVFSGDNFYGAIKVIDIDYGGDAIERQLLIDGLQQGGQDIKRGQTVNRYPYLMEYLTYRLQPKGRDCLVVGLGAGFIPTWYSARGIRTDVVDIDPLIPQLARDYFGFKTSGDVVVADARHFLLTTQRQYDYIILDAYNGDLMPHHLISREMFSLIAQHLRPGGVLGINFIGSVGEQRRMTSSVVRTLRSVFEMVDVYPGFEVTDTSSIGNLEILAYNGARTLLPLGEVPGLAIHPLVNSAVRSFMRQSYPYPVDADALVLTDDYNPIDFFDAGLRETVRGWLLESTAKGLLTR